MKRLVNGIEIELPDQSSEVTVTKLPDRLAVRSPAGTFTAIAVKEADKVHISFKGCQYTVERMASRAGSAAGSSSSGDLRAPMPGQVVEVLAAEGDRVGKGDKLVILEAMKTQQAFLAPFDGTVTQMSCKKGEQVAEGALLASITRDEGREQET